MIIILLIFWFIFSGNISLYFVISALLSSILTIYIDRKLFKVSPLFIGFNIEFIFFLAKLFKEMYLSTKLMLKVIWFNSKNLQPVIITIKAKSKDKLHQVIQANCITLTPGTMTLTLENNQILVHAISKEAASSIFGDKA